MSENKISKLENKSNRTGVLLERENDQVIVSKKFGEGVISFDTISQEGDPSVGTFEIDVDDLYTILMLLEEGEFNIISKEMDELK